jgi:MtrB/PioB family decaheme-associated outer membrane protein
MKTGRLGVFLAGALVAGASDLFAQTNPPGQQPPALPESTQATLPFTPRRAHLDFGIRLNGVDGDAARFQRFRDWRDGPIISLASYSRTTGTWAFDAVGENVGYRDQRLAADWNRFGRMRASFEWTQIPWFHSIDTRTPFLRDDDADDDGELRLPDGLQNGALAAIAAAGSRFDTRARRDIADARFSYEPSRSTGVNLRFTSTQREGEQPWGAGFGFTAVNEVPLPLDQRTTDLNASFQWADAGRVLQVGYAGSFFDNAVPVLVWDSPLSASDAVGNPAQGRMPIFPSSTSHTVSAMGAWPLPGRSRAHAYVSIGSWVQDQPLVPHTINTALPQPALARSTADARARIIATNLGFTTRAARSLMLNTRFRIYDFDNRTRPFPQPAYIRADQTVATSLLGTSEPFEYKRHFLDVNAVYTGLSYASLRFGYGLEHDDRRYRYVHETTDHVFRASIDTSRLTNVMVRAQYEHSNRTGEGFDEQALSAVNEQLSLRQFDISDRARDRISTIVQFTPSDILGITATIGIGRDDRPDEFFGLLDNHHRFFTVGFDVTPSDAFTASVSYGRENYDTLQRSRQANPGDQFNDPRRDWETDMDEDVDTFSANVELPALNERTSVRFGYDLSRAESRYLYLLAPDSTLATPEQLPPVKNTFHRAHASARYDFTSRLALGVSYWFDRYAVSDFAREPDVLEPLGIPGSGLFLGYVFQPYTAHTATVRLIVDW